jgi:hypothetical protein
VEDEECHGGGIAGLNNSFFVLVFVYAFDIFMDVLFMCVVIRQ